MTTKKEAFGNKTQKEIKHIQKDVKRGKRYASLRLWLASIAFCIGIMSMVVGGLLIEENVWIWWISGGIGAFLVLVGFHYLSTC